MPSANILTLRTLRRLFPARMIFWKESPQYAAASSKYFMPYTRICQDPSASAVTLNRAAQTRDERWGPAEMRRRLCGSPEAGQLVLLFGSVALALIYRALPERQRRSRLGHMTYRRKNSSEIGLNPASCTDVRPRRCASLTVAAKRFRSCLYVGSGRTTRSWALSRNTPDRSYRSRIPPRRRRGPQ